MLPNSNESPISVSVKYKVCVKNLHFSTEIAVYPVVKVNGVREGLSPLLPFEPPAIV